MNPDVALRYDGFDPAAESLREALTSTGNGNFATRGTAEWEDTGDVHYAGTYAHGGYDRTTTIVGGHPVPNEDLVNLPNWLVLKLRIEGEDAVRLADVELVSYRHDYDVRLAMVVRELRFRDRSGRETSLRSRRFVSMAHAHRAAIEWTLLPENWSGRIEVVAALDGRVTNRLVKRYRDLEGQHLDPVSTRDVGPEAIALAVRTRRSHIDIAEAARTRAFRGDVEIDAKRRIHRAEGYIQQSLGFDVTQGEAVRVEKLVSLFTSHDNAIAEPLTAACWDVLRHPDVARALREHEAAWTELWDLCDITLPHEPRVQLLLRLHTAHVLQVCSRHTAGRDAGVPARGLGGEAYRGHVFWDELYVQPFITLRLPEVTRGLLRYRFNRLPEARAAACAAGYAGAMFPWQSGSDGTEETQVVHLNPLSGRWDPDLSHIQRHVNAAIFHNVWQYYRTTGDLEFLRDHGAELMLDIACFWASIARFDPERSRFEIHGVMGPDEFHQRYPGSDEAGLRNNAYTNVMVAWIADIAPQVLDVLPAARRAALCARLGLTHRTLARWRGMAARMFVPFHESGGGDVISQFEGYDKLEELDWDRYRAEHGDIGRLDRILKAEGDDPDRYQLAKQADTVMLFYLFTPAELGAVLDRLGYAHDPDLARRTIDYYDRRTTHGSTLSLITHAHALAALDPESSWRRFEKALRSDVDDTQGGTTHEGIHLGVIAGSLDLLQRGYLGATVRDGVLRVEPRLLDRLDGLSAPLQVLGTSVLISIADHDLTVHVRADGFRAPVPVSAGGLLRALGPGETWTVSLPRT
ncbi:MAG: glycoside hydrolase family 65 protein [Pseudonocardiales bacterium]|nr:glycoside hydrolase family 65 protein [Pseudonocardiales bacterium]